MDVKENSDSPELINHRFYNDEPKFSNDENNESWQLLQPFPASESSRATDVFPSTIITKPDPTDSTDQIESLRTRLAGPSTGKAGLEGIDKEKVNQIIYEVSKGSAFFENERKKDEALTAKIDIMLAKINKLKDIDLSDDLMEADVMLRELEAKRDLTQICVLLDMDAFYASVEERDRPDLKTKPMAVGDTAMLTTANYIARKYGVRSAMPGYIAQKLCPDLILIPPDFKKYTAVSHTIRSIFAKYDPTFAPMSLDEAYLNITEYISSHSQPADQVVAEIRAEIEAQTGLTASAGIAANKLLAKICADKNKPNGQFWLPSDRDAILEFMSNLPVRKISGIGRVTERVLNALGVNTCGDIWTQRAILHRVESEISFTFLLNCYLGIGSNKVENEWERKSMGVERTFQSMSNPDDLYDMLKTLANKLAEELEPGKLSGKTITLKLKFTNFQVITRAKALSRYIFSEKDIYNFGKQILDSQLPVSIRLMGLRLSNMRNRDETTSGMKRFFGAEESHLLPKKPRTDHDEDQAPTEQLTTIPEVDCPICSKKFQCIDNEFLNRHIDECLSKEEVKTLLAKDKAEKPEKLNTDPNGSVASIYSSKDLKVKKHSPGSGSNTTLLKYFTAGP